MILDTHVRCSSINDSKLLVKHQTATPSSRWLDSNFVRPGSLQIRVVLSLSRKSDRRRHHLTSWVSAKHCHPGTSLITSVGGTRTIRRHQHNTTPCLHCTDDTLKIHIVVILYYSSNRTDRQAGNHLACGKHVTS